MDEGRRIAGKGRSFFLMRSGRLTRPIPIPRNMPPENILPEATEVLVMGLFQKNKGQIAGDAGFSLVEVMIVTAIVTILTTVIAPAYINYKNRAYQTSGLEALFRARVDQENFRGEKFRYADTIGCLASFGGNCAKKADTMSHYTVTVDKDLTDDQSYSVRAVRVIPIKNTTDVIVATEATTNPVILNPDALKVSLYNIIFGE